MIYDYYKERGKRGVKGKIILGAIIVSVIILLIIASNIYMEVIQLDEIGKLSGIYLKNLLYKIIFSSVSFIVIFILVSITNMFIKNNLKKYLKENNFPSRILPNFLISTIFAIFGALTCKDYFYQKALNFLNAVEFGKTDPIFVRDIGFYIFQRPFLMSIYSFMSALWMIIIIYTMIYYLAIFLSLFDNITMENLKVKSILRHNLINIAIFFFIKAFSYEFQKQGLLFSSFINVKGAGYVDVNIWMNYFKLIPFLLILIVIIAFIFIWRGRLKGAALTIAVYPAIWIIVAIIAGVTQGLIVKPNEINLENTYLKYNMQKTREAYYIDKVKNLEFPAMQDLTSEIINRNIDTKNNIRIVDYQATLDTDIQLQSNTNFYSFHNGDIINYTINGKETPVFITAREIDKNKLPEKSYINTMFKYTHGYGVVMNPINKLTADGQVDYILSGLRMNSKDKNLNIKEKRIYYGELTEDHVIVNAGNNLNEIDYDGNTETRYDGKGGIKLELLNRLLFALKYGDFNMIISGYVSPESKLLLNREILQRAQKAVPFLSIDSDPYIIITTDGRLKWVIDAYTMTNYYPYSQQFSDFNYIRNSVKIIIDAYDGDVKYYIIDKEDPIIKTYQKTYPGIFTDEPLPADVSSHMRYPELLFKVQTEMMKRYHLNPDLGNQNISMFYSNQDLWYIAKYPARTDIGGVRSVDSSDVVDIEPYYNMIKLPGGVGTKEELILMRPFTPSKKNNMVSWLAVRNDADNYGEMILFGFPKNTNILGPYQIEVKINQIDKVSKDMTLWGQSGSRVFKGSLLVIPIENSVLYVEPIYIQSMGSSSIPEVREIVVGYQKGEEFKYGIGTTLDEALGQLFGDIKNTPMETIPGEEIKPEPKTSNEKLINDIMSKYDAIKKQLDELGGLIDELK